MKKLSLEQMLPHFVAIAVFVILTLIFFKPYLSGYTLKQGDITNYKGMAKEIVEHREIHGDDPLWVGSMFSGMPAYQISVKYGDSNFLTYIDKTFRLFTSNPIWYLFLYMLGFYIFLMCLKIDPWLAIVGSIAFGFSTYFLIILEAGHNSKAHAIAYMAPTLGAIILTYRGKLLLGGALTALFLGLELLCNHYQITYYLGIIVLLYGGFALVNAMMEEKIPQFVKATGVLIVAAALGLGANIAQIWNTMEYGADTTRGKTELTINRNGTTNEGNRTGGLPRDYIKEWSYGTGETFNLFIPALKGNGSGYLAYEEGLLDNASYQNRQQLAQSSTYWGNQRFTSGPVYIGAIVIFLALLCMVYVKSWIKWPMLIATLLSIIMAWGGSVSGITDFFVDYLPGYNKFRTVSMVLVIAEFTLPFMAILYLHELFKNKAEMAKNMVPFIVVSGITVFGLFLFLIMPDVFFNFLSSNEASAMAGATPEQLSYFNELIEVRKGIYAGDVWRTLGFVVLAGGLVVAYLRIKNVHKGIIIGALGLFITVDLMVVDKRFLNGDELPDNSGNLWNWELNEDGNKAAYTATEADRIIVQMETGNHPELTNEINAALKKRTQEKRDNNEAFPTLNQNEIDEIAFKAVRRKSNNRVLDLTAGTFNSSRASYFHKSIGGYHGAKMKRYQEVIDWYLGPEIGLINNTLQSQPSQESLAYTLQSIKVLNMLNTRYIIYNPNATPLLNQQAMGDAWFVQTVQTAANADEEMKLLGTINPSRDVAIDKRYMDKVQAFNYDPTATIELVKYETNHLTYQTKAASPQFAVFSEIYYKEWNAYIDGKPADHIRANYLLRGMMVPAGDHTIEFKFESSMYNTGTTLTAICSGLIIVLVLGAIVLSFREETDPESLQEELQKLG